MTSRSEHLQRTSFHAAKFGWDPLLIAVTRHASLPWNDAVSAHREFDAWPLHAARTLGEADRLSLLGQYAAHLGFLRLVEQHDVAFDADEWCYTKKRGEDPLLLRLQQSVRSLGLGSPLDLIEEFAAHVAAPPTLTIKQSWARPEALFVEVERSLRASGSRCSNLRAAALGMMLPPGVAGLRAVVEGGSLSVTDPGAVRARLDDLRLLGVDIATLSVGGARMSPLVPYSAFDLSPQTLAMEPAAIAEILARSLSAKAAVIVSGSRSIDAKSRTLLQILRSTLGEASWIEENGNAAPLDGGRFYLVSVSVASAIQMDAVATSMSYAKASRWLADLVTSAEYASYLQHGAVPPAPREAAPVSLDEPYRSCLASIAFLGGSVGRPAAAAMLARIGLDLDVDALAIDGVTRIDGERLSFNDGWIRESLKRSLDAETQQLLARTAATVLAECRLAEPLFELVQQWPHREILELLERIASDEELERNASVLTSLPREISRDLPRVASALASYLLRCGRYLDARELAAASATEHGAVVIAASERRIGAYAAALSRLSETSLPEGVLLRAELLRLTGDAAGAIDQLASPVLGEAKALSSRVAYERAMLALDAGEAFDASTISDEYLSQRLRCYQALSEQRWDDAELLAAEAAALAADIPSRIDAELDKLYARFLAGRWDDARLQARAALSVIEETQGDRAAGGVLFTLAYLCAENGAWRDAERQIARLDAFYRRNADARRLREVDLLRAHLAFCRADFAPASRIASSVVDALSGDIGEAAALIVDEAAWIRGENLPLVSTGRSQCVELTARHALLCSRQNGRASDELGAFGAQLFAYEQSARTSSATMPPQAASPSEQQQLYRSLRGLATRGCGSAALMSALERELNLTAHVVKPAESSSNELAALQRLAAAEYPFSDGALEGEWLIASRNRLGRWVQHGSGKRRENEELSRLLGTDEVIPLSEHSFLLMPETRSWSVESRNAVGGIVAARIELHNARRLLDQERAGEEQRPAQVEGIIGESAAIRTALGKLELIAARDMPVVILGESGTGKELIARAVHRASSRRRGVFTAVNCAALPENLVESELFGHVRGAFTGADKDRVGIIESTDGGTLFLDEIGELPLPAQAKLLRFLQEGEIRRVGDTTIRSADVRLVAATHRRLDQWVDEHRFREDLYYRIRGVELTLPPLRERGSDILLLAREFLARERQRHSAGPDRFSDAVEDLFASYSWPGNIRELQNTVRAAHALAGDGRYIDVQHLPERIRNVTVVRGATGTYYEELTRFRRSLIEQSLVQAGGNQNRAAQMLGMSRQALAYQIRELGVLVRKSRAEN